MDEKTELKIKNYLCEFIRNNFVLEGEPEMVKQKVRDLADGIFILFRNLTK